MRKEIGSRLWNQLDFSQFCVTVFICEVLLPFRKIHGVIAESEETKRIMHKIESRKLMIFREAK